MSFILPHLPFLLLDRDCVVDDGGQRGGQGNVYLDKEHAKEKEEKKEERKRIGMSLLDKVKHLFGFGK